MRSPFLICQKILNPNMTEYQRAKAIHKYCVLNFYRTPMNTLSAAKSISDKLDYTSEEAQARIKKYGKKVDKMIASGKAVVNNTDNRELGSRLNRMITAMGKQTGDCLNMAYYMEALMRHAGLECDILYNDLPYGHELKHFWNTVKVDGVVYMCDARIENARLDGNNVTFSHFLRGKNTMSKINADDDLRYGTICSTGHYRETYKTVSNTDYPRG